MTTLTELEGAVLDKLLDGEHLDLEILRAQVKALVVEKREMTGVGFYTHLSVPSSIERLPRKASFQIKDVTAHIPGLKNGAGFILFVNDGAVDFLEGFTYDEAWPDQVRKFELEYDHLPRGFRFLQE